MRSAIATARTAATLRRARRLTLLLLLAGWPTGNAAAQGPLARGPYLQSLLQDSVKVLWLTSAPSIGAVRVLPAGAGPILVEETEAATRHVVKVTGLAPLTDHAYEILADRTLLAGGERLRFRTPPPAGHGEIRAVVFGDSGDLSVNGENFQHGVTALLEPLNPGLFLHTGDYVYSGTIDEVFFLEYRSLLERIGVFPTRGNHDSIPLPVWYELFSPPDLPFEVPTCRLPAEVCDEDPPRAPPPLDKLDAACFSFDWGPAHFASIDSDHAIEACSNQWKWLCDDLSAARARGSPWLILYLHEAPYTAGLNGPSSLDMPPRFPRMHSKIPPIADRFGVDLVISGHDHNYQRSYPLREGRIADAYQDPGYRSPRGTVYVVTGGGGTRTYPERPGAIHRPLIKVFHERHHAVLLEVSETSLEVQAFAPGMELLDRFTIRKDEGPYLPAFRRGDANLDGRIDVADAVSILGHLFLGSGLDCAPAFGVVADTNSSQAVDLADAVYLLSYLYLGGPAPAAPFAECELLPGIDGTECLRAPCSR